MPLVLIIFLPVIFIWSYYFTANTWINVDTVLAILQTNLNEAQEYIYQFVTVYSFLSTIILLSIILVVSLKLIPQLKNVYLNKHFICLIVICLICNIILIYKCRDNLVTSVFHEAHRYTNTYNDFNKFKENRKSKLVLSTNPNPGIYVLVIGESHSKDYSSAYGYELDTTPWLKSISKQPNTILLKNAYSCHVQTVPCVTYALTAKNQYNLLDLKDSLSLLEVVEKAGFETVWLSNQGKFGFNDTPITVIADEANQQFWINENGLRIDQKPYDEEILKFIPNITLSKNMLIVIHLMGSHASYSHRYPKHFSHFNENPLTCEYNNTILYNDYVIENIYNKFRDLPNFQTMIYFSDHGEKLGVGHNTSHFDKCMSNIPAYFIFDNSYIKNYPNIINTLSKNSNYIFTNDLIYNTVLGIMNINLKDTTEPHNNLASEAYDSNPYRFTTMYGKVKIVE